MVVMIAVIIMKKYQKLTKKVNLLKSNKKRWKLKIKKVLWKEMRAHPRTKKTICVIKIKIINKKK
jgi:hypothetical protein